MVSVAGMQGKGEGAAAIVAGLSAEDSARVSAALALVEPMYAGKPIPSGQDAWQFVQGVVTVLEVGS